jgi:hypothetical protein
MPILLPTELTGVSSSPAKCTSASVVRRYPIARIHILGGFRSTGLEGEVSEIDAPGLGPADLTTLEFKHIARHLHPSSNKRKSGASIPEKWSARIIVTVEVSATRPVIPSRLPARNHES